MHTLSRTVRFCVPVDGRLDRAPGRVNGHGGWPPPPDGLGVWGALTVACRGEPDPTTGYLINIAHIDRAVRERALPILADALRQRSATPAVNLIVAMRSAIEAALSAPVHAIEWHVTPHHRIAVGPTDGGDGMDRVLMTQEFSFSASHRLHVDRLSAEENRAVFGKCNNANGHGHNYRVDVAISYPVDLEGGPGAGRLEEVVMDHVIEPLDHKHLNLDTDDFREAIPSVETIARVCHDRLVDPVTALGARLEHVTVWETDKTNCRYPG